jgi:hypothetical protein
MPEMVKSSETKLFADDSLLFRTINNQADSVLLQNDLTSLQDWEEKWQMSFNAKKCRVALCRTFLQSLARWYLLVSLFPILMLFHGWLL